RKSSLSAQRWETSQSVTDEFRRARRSQLANADEQEDGMTETKTRTNITQVGTVIVPVSDQDRALEFYVDKLGFEKRTDTPYGDGDRWVEVAPAGAATTIALVRPREGESAGVEGRVGLATEDLDAGHADLRAAGQDADEAQEGLVFLGQGPRREQVERVEDLLNPADVARIGIGELLDPLLDQRPVARHVRRGAMPPEAAVELGADDPLVGRGVRQQHLR